jgi:hypothetical protein
VLPDVSVTVAEPPLSVAVSCHGWLPSVKPVLAIAVRVTRPGFWQIVVVPEPLRETSPLTVTEHPPSKFLITRPTRVSLAVLAQPESPEV